MQALYGSSRLWNQGGVTEHCTRSDTQGWASGGEGLDFLVQAGRGRQSGKGTGENSKDNNKDIENPANQKALTTDEGGRKSNQETSLAWSCVAKFKGLGKNETEDKSN